MLADHEAALAAEGLCPLPDWLVKVAPYSPDFDPRSQPVLCALVFAVEVRHGKAYIRRTYDRGYTYTAHVATLDRTGERCFGLACEPLGDDASAFPGLPGHAA